MDNEDMYKSYCDRLIAYISNRMTFAKVVLEEKHGYYIYIRDKDPLCIGSSLLFQSNTYKGIFYKLLLMGQCKPFITENMSLEEVDMKLTIRGY